LVTKLKFIIVTVTNDHVVLEVSAENHAELNSWKLRCEVLTALEMSMFVFWIVYNAVCRLLVDIF
jgi:hypothetical protein